MADRRYSATLGQSGARRRNTTASRRTSLRQQYTQLETKKTSQNFKKLVAEMRKQLEEIKKRDIVPLSFEEIQGRISDLDLEQERLDYMLQAAQSSNADPETTLALNEAIASISEVTDEYQAVLLEGRARNSSLLESVGGYASRAIKRKVFSTRNAIIERGVESLRADSLKGAAYRWMAGRSKNNQSALARGFRWYTGLNNSDSAEELLARVKRISRMPNTAPAPPPPPPPAALPAPASPASKKKGGQRGSGRRANAARMQKPPKTARNPSAKSVKGFDALSEKDTQDFNPQLAEKADVDKAFKRASGFDVLFSNIANSVKSVGAIFSANNLAAQAAKEMPSGELLVESKRQHAETTKLYKQALKSEAEFREQAKKDFDRKFDKLLDKEDDILEETKNGAGGKGGSNVLETALGTWLGLKGLKWTRGLFNWGKTAIGLGGAAAAGGAVAGGNAAAAGATSGGLAAASRAAPGFFGKTLGFAGKVATPLAFGYSGYELATNQRDQYGDRKPFFGEEGSGFSGLMESRAADYGTMIAAGAGIGSFIPGVGTVAGAVVGGATAGVIDLFERLFNGPSQSIENAATRLADSANLTEEQQEKLFKRVAEMYGPDQAKAFADAFSKRLDENMKASDLANQITNMARRAMGLAPINETTITAHKRTSEQFTGTGDTHGAAPKRTLPQYAPGTFTAIVNGETHAFEPDASSPTGYKDVGVYDFRRINGPVDVEVPVNERTAYGVSQPNAALYNGEGNDITPSGHKGPFASLLNRIAQSEGTATQTNSGYDTEFAYGKYSPGGEKRISEMTLDELDAYQTGMLNMPGNDIAGKGSSAVGRYQYLRTQMREFRNKYDPNSAENVRRKNAGERTLYDPAFRARAEAAGLSFDGSQVFDGGFQDRLASFDIMERGGGRSFMEGRSTPEEFQNDLAPIWASIPTTGGASMYGQPSVGTPQQWMEQNLEMRDSFMRANAIEAATPDYIPPELFAQGGSVPVKMSDGSTRMVNLGDPNARMGQAFGGGEALSGTYSAASELMGLGGIERFTGFRDEAHVGRRSAHNDGRAGDLTLTGLPRDFASLTEEHKQTAAQKAQQIRAMFAARGLKEGEDFTVLDEYNQPSKHASAPHLHYQFNSKEAADKYNAAYARAQAENTPRQTDISADVAEGTRFNIFDDKKTAANDSFQFVYTPRYEPASSTEQRSLYSEVASDPALKGKRVYFADDENGIMRRVEQPPNVDAAVVNRFNAFDGKQFNAFGEPKKEEDPFQFSYEPAPVTDNLLGSASYEPSKTQTAAPIMNDFFGASDTTNLEGGAGTDRLLESNRTVSSVERQRQQTIIKRQEILTAIRSGALDPAIGARRLFATDNPNLPLPSSIIAPMENMLTEKLGVDVFSPGAFQYGPSITPELLRMPSFDLFSRNTEAIAAPSVKPQSEAFPDFAYYSEPPFDLALPPPPPPPAEPQVIVMPAPKEKERRERQPILKRRPPPITLDEPVLEPALAKLLAWDRDE